MAGCGQCPDECNCVIVDENGVQYDGAGNALDPMVIPRAQNTPWEGTSSDGSITITEGDVVDPNDDKHAPDLVVNFCNVLDQTTREYGDIMIFNEDEDDCRPELMRDPLPGEFMGLDPVSGKAGWVQGAVIASGAVPYGVPLPFFGPEANIPAGFISFHGQLLDIAVHPNLFATIGFSCSPVPGADPGGGQFYAPDCRDRTLVGKGDQGGVDAARIADAATLTLGGSSGVDQVTLAIAQIPAHAHGVTDPGHGHATNNPAHGHGISDPGHAHGASSNTVNDHVHGAPGGRYFVTVNPPPLNVLIANDTPDTLNIVLSNADSAQKNNQFTELSGAHAHTITVNAAATGVSVLNGTTAISVNPAGTGISIQNNGGGGAHNNLQPFITCNWIGRAG